MKRIGRASIVSTAFVLNACALSAGKPTLRVGTTQHEPVLLVQNSHWSDMTVYAEVSGIRFRLGGVTSMASAALPWPISAGHGDTVRLILDPVGSDRPFTTEPIARIDGLRMVFQIENHLPPSGLYTR